MKTKKTPEEKKAERLKIQKNVVQFYKDHGLEAVPEFRFHPQRNWRFDYAFPKFKVAIEVQGGLFIRGGHNRGAGYLQDMEKFNHAAAVGWLIIQCQPKDICMDETVQFVKDAIDSRSDFS